MLEGINQQIKAALPTLPAGKALARVMADVASPMGSGTFSRCGLPYTLWMAQRTLDLYHAMSAQEQEAVKDWLKEVGGMAFLTLDIPRLRRSGLRVVLLGKQCRILPRQITTIQKLHRHAPIAKTFCPVRRCFDFARLLDDRAGLVVAYT
jgi:hypothetical protein